MTGLKRLLRISVLFLGDVLWGVLTYGVLAWLKFGGPVPEYNRGAMLFVAATSIVATLLTLILFKGYRDLHRPSLDLASATVLSVLVGSAIGMIFAYVFNAAAAPRSVIGLAAPVYAILLSGWRFFFGIEAKRTFYARPAILISSTHTPDRARGAWSLPPYVNIDESISPRRFLECPIQEIPRHRLWIVGPELDIETRRRVLDRLFLVAGDAIVVPEVSDLIVRRGRVTHFGDLPVLEIPSFAIPVEYRLIKRLLDVAGSLLLLIVFSPLFLIVPLANRLLCPGPTFYRQVRVGQGGRPFWILKFRSMIPDAEQETGAVLAELHDGRVTPVGRVLRAIRLDEIPQLWNVLRGEMSLVGPRPERPELVDQYVAVEPNFRFREAVKPGITGLAQTLGRYDTLPSSKLRFDLLYITTYSPWLDLQILIWTVQLVLFPQRWVDAPPRWIERLEHRMITSPARLSQLEAGVGRDE